MSLLSFENIWLYPERSVQSLLDVNSVCFVLPVAWAVGQWARLLGPVEAYYFINSARLTTAEFHLLIGLLKMNKYFYVTPEPE